MESVLQKLLTKRQGQAWRNTIQPGDKVDALLHQYDRMGISRGSGWSQARISRIEGDQLYLEYMQDVKSCDRTIDRWSVEIAPYESQTKDIWEWKQTLKKDD